MKLYYAPGACSLSPHIVLREGGYDFTLERVDLATGKTETGADYKSVNPNGFVPALMLDEGVVLTEGPAIVQYLADHAADRNLAPAAGTLDRYRLMQWLNFIPTELHKICGILFDPELPDGVRQKLTGRLSQRFASVSDALAGRTFILGDQFTVADAYLFTVLSWAPYLKLDLSPWPALGAYVGRIGSRPAVQQALAAEGLLPG
ncbi:MAG TPA: glutathione transferase GstA [Gammaproteobacteria bacterium]|nr:glutathione transferase GstA [Gammaproteobacteria bacterium]